MTDAPPVDGPDDAETPGKIGPDDAETAIENPPMSLADAVRDPQTLPVSELRDDELAGEHTRLIKYRAAITEANEAWKAAVKDDDDQAQARRLRISELRTKLRDAENAFQPVEIAGRLAEIEAVVRTTPVLAGG